VAVGQTTNCGKFGHPEFRLIIDKAKVPVAEDLKWLVNWLEQSVAEGERYAPEQTCQIGWMVTKVGLGEDGLLTLWEPDLRAMPVVWVESVSSTLAHLRLQKDVVESVLAASALTFPSMRQSAIICTRLGNRDHLVLERTQPKAADSGWFFGCRDKDHDHNDATELRCVSLYEAAVSYAPQIIPYLALPPGVLIALENDAPAIFHNGEALDFLKGSFLAARYPNR
jgi:hypothetical protein